MKNLIIALAASFLVTSQATAQVTIREEIRPMSAGSFNAMVIDFPDTKRKNIEKTWSRFVKEYKGKNTHNKKTGEFLSDESTIKEMSKDKVDIFARFVENNKSTEMAVWFDLGASNFVASNTDIERDNVAQVILQQFILTVSAGTIKTHLKIQEKQLKAQYKVLKKMEQARAKEDKMIAKSNEIIRKQQAAIAKSETNINSNLTTQATQKGEIDKQNQGIDETKSQLKKIKKQ